MGLQPPGRRPLHLLAHPLDGHGVEPFAGELVAGDEAVDVVDVDGAVDRPEQAFAHVRPFAVADRLHEELAQRPRLEQLAEDVVDPAPQRLPGRLELLQQPPVNRAFPRLARHQVPEVTDLGLTDPVDPAETLLQAVGVPRQVVVDHEMGAALEVYALPRRIVGKEESNRGIVVEGGNRGPSPIARHASVDDRDAFRLPGSVTNAPREVLERVARLGEDDDLPADVPPRVVHHGLGENAVELAPLGVLSRAPERLRHQLEPPELGDLRFELGDRLRGGRPVEEPLLMGLQLLAGGLFEVVLVKGGFEPGGRDPVAIAPAARSAELLLFQPPFEAGETTPQRLVDRGRRGREAALQDLEREPDVVSPPGTVFADPVGAVHLLAHVVGDRFVEPGFPRGELVGDRVGAAFRKEGAPVETEQLLLGEAAHHVRGVHLVDPLPESALEPVRVQKAHEELKVLLLAVVRGRGHQQEVPREPARERPQLIAPGVPDLLAEEARRHAVRLVADDEVPFRRCLELRLEVVVSRQHVEARDEERLLRERVAGRSRLDLLAAQDVEHEVELVRELVLPLLDQAPGGDDEAPFEAAPDEQLLDEETRHHRLASAGVVGEEKPERLAVQHRAVDRGQLMRERLDLRRVHRDVRIEEMREPNAKRLRGEPEEVPVAVERKAARGRHLAEPGLVLAKEDAVPEPLGSPPGHFHRVGAVGAGGEDLHLAVSADTGEPATRHDAFELHHRIGPSIHKTLSCERRSISTRGSRPGTARTPAAWARQTA